MRNGNTQAELIFNIILANTSPDEYSQNQGRNNQSHHLICQRVWMQGRERFVVINVLPISLLKAFLLYLERNNK